LKALTGLPFSLFQWTSHVSSIPIRIINRKERGAAVIFWTKFEEELEQVLARNPSATRGWLRYLENYLENIETPQSEGSSDMGRAEYNYTNIVKQINQGATDSIKVKAAVRAIKIGVAE
jgi:hypothetical protein